MQDKRKHLAPLTPQEEIEKNKKDRLVSKVAYVTALILTLAIAVFAFIMLLRSFKSSDFATPDESTPDEVMTMGVYLIDDDGNKIVPTQLATVKPTAVSNTTPTVVHTESETEQIIVYIAETSIEETEPTTANNISYGGYLIEIDNPDYTYSPQVIHLDDSDRELAAKIIMREFGDGGFEACCLQAQALRDAMIFSRSSLEQIYHFFQYDAYSIDYTPNRDCYDAIDYIFESGGLAVPHRILVMYNPAHATSTWHETQVFVVDYDGVRYFDMR